MQGRRRFITFGFAGLALSALLLFSALEFWRVDRASVQLPQAFLRLERALGYDGFIHHFKNAVLRPDEQVYWARARETQAEAEAALAEIAALKRSLGAETDFAPITDTLQDYSGMLDRARALADQGLTAREIDAQVRVSDVDAAAAIRGLEERISDLMTEQHSTASAVLMFAIVAALAGALAFTVLQVRARQSAEAMNARLREQDAFLMRSEEIARLGRWKREPDGHLSLSQNGRGILGLAEQGGADLRALVHQDDLARFDASLKRLAEDGHDSAELFRAVRPDGKIVHLRMNGERVASVKGRDGDLVGTFLDVTEYVETAEKLRQSQKMEVVGNLAGGLAHDFNNILMVILNNLELLQEVETLDWGKPLVQEAIDATDRGASLTRNMLSFAQKSPLAPALLRADELVTSVLDWSHRLLPENIRVEASTLAGLWSIRADRALAQSALLNLILNARDAMPDGGTITIETGNVRVDEDYIRSREEVLDTGRYVMLAVSDTGVGMSPETLERIFDPFFTTKPPGSGTGLGLSMVHGFMKQSGGTVRVYSEPGVGTTFKLFFKAVSDAPQPAAPAPDADDGPLVGSGRLLLVEDGTDVLRVLARTLKDAGFDVTEASTGDAALAMWNADPTYDLVVTDIVMPGKLQGTDLARALRATRPDLPVIFMSGYSTEATVNGNGLHPDDVRLMKPVSRKVLVKAVIDLLKRSKDQGVS